MSEFKVFPDSPAFPETHVYHWRSTEKRDDGTPYESDNVIPRYNGGLTKREYFAAMAMQGFLARTPWQQIIYVWIRNTTLYRPEFVAEVAIQCADALIEELNK